MHSLAAGSGEPNLDQEAHASFVAVCATAAAIAAAVAYFFRPAAAKKVCLLWLLYGALVVLILA